MLPKEMRHISGCGCGCGGVSSRVHGAVKYSTGMVANPVQSIYFNAYFYAHPAHVHFPFNKKKDIK